MKKLLESSTFQWAYALVMFFALAIYRTTSSETVQSFALTSLIILALPMLTLIFPIIKVMVAGGVRGYQNNQSWRSRG